MGEKDESAAAQAVRNFRKHPVVLWRVLEGNAGAEEERQPRIDARPSRIDRGRRDIERLEVTAEMRQRDEALGVVRLRRFRFELLAREVVIDGRQAARLRVSPARRLDRRQAQAREAHGHRIHADLGIDQHVELLRADGVHPLAQLLRAALVVRSARFGESGFLVLVDPDVEGVKRKAPRIEFLEPAFGDRAPYRVVAQMG